MESLQATYKDDDDDDDEDNSSNTTTSKGDDLIIPSEPGDPRLPTTTIDTTSIASATPDIEAETLNGVKDEPLSDTEPRDSPDLGKSPSENDEQDGPLRKKQKQVSPAMAKADRPSSEDHGSSVPPQSASSSLAVAASKKSKKKSKNNNVWTRPTSRKGKKKAKNQTSSNAQKEDTVLITPVARFHDKNDDSPEMKICLSKVYKAEKVEMSDDRLSAGSCKGYRMVRATRGVMEGAWYFEIKVMNLGETGHTRLGWAMEKVDLQAPVGYDANSFGYRDIDGSKIHKALREKYGEEGYAEGDVIGFYINLPEGNLYAPKLSRLELYKGQRYVCAPEVKEDPPKVVPGSEISFFKNGKCQGVAFKDLFGGRYYPAASMYTLPNQLNCVVSFNFGPDFEAFPDDVGERPLPKPMIEVPYHGFEGRIENGNPWGSTRMCPTLKVVEQDTRTVDTAKLIC